MGALAADIWASFRRLPFWVQVWVALILVPVNLTALAFVTAPLGGWIAVLAVGGMAPNLMVMVKDRGFSRLMAVPHVLIWTPLVVIVIGLLEDTILIDGAYRVYLICLLVVDMVSLCFDYVDSWKWWKGDRKAA